MTLSKFLVSHKTVYFGFALGTKGDRKMGMSKAEVSESHPLSIDR